MKLLVAASTFPSGELDGSRPRFVYDLAEAIASQDVRVWVLAPHHPGAATTERMGSVEVLRYRYWWPPSAARLTPNMVQRVRESLLAKIQVPFFFVAQLWSLWRATRRHGIDVVNAHWIVPQGLTAALLRGRRRPRFVLAVHAHAGDVYLLARLPFGATIARYILSRADCVFAAGSHVRDTLDALIRAPSGARIQPMGVHTELFRAPPEPTLPEAPHFPEGFILFTGRLVEKKGVTYLLRALPRILREHPGIGVVLVGSGPDEPMLRKEVASLSIERSVVFAGHRPHEEVAALLHRCRVAAVPSIVDSRGETEGMPTVVLEAMAAGVRVVGSAVDGIPDVIRDKENGWLCREKDPVDLSEKLLEALGPSAPNTIRDAARGTASRFDWQEVAKTYVTTIRRAMG